MEEEASFWAAELEPSQPARAVAAPQPQPQQPKLIYLYGLPAAGKNHVGELLEREFGFCFFDADEWLLPDMLASLERKEGFTPEQRDRYYRAVIERTRELFGGGGSGGGPIAVAQATFKEQHRRWVAAAFPGAELWWVVADEPRRAERLRRGGNRVDAALGAAMRKEFEAPPPAWPSPTCHCQILNSGGGDGGGDGGGAASLLEQIRVQLGLRAVAPTAE